jgi:putative Holliday junction resolvase
MKLLAIDFGMKRIGFAIGSIPLNTATPAPAMLRKNSKQAVQYIKQLVHEHDITRIVVGYPLHMDGSRGAITEQVEHFTNRLKKAFEPGIPVEWADERLSSFEAEEAVKDLPLPAGKRKEIIDSMAAVVIARRFMESRHEKTESP